MISEGSCDTEDWSNDAENTAAHHRNKSHFTIYLHRKQLFEIVILHCFCCIFFDQINAALVNIRGFQKSYRSQTFEHWINHIMTKNMILKQYLFCKWFFL